MGGRCESGSDEPLVNYIFMKWSKFSSLLSVVSNADNVNSHSNSLRSSQLGFPTSHLFPATLTLLSGTSGPWVELKMDCSSIARNGDIHHAAPRGQWASVRVVTLGREVRLGRFPPRAPDLTFFPDACPHTRCSSTRSRRYL